MQYHHISTQFDVQLEQVRSKILHMGAAVEDQLSLAVRALQYPLRLPDSSFFVAP